MLAEGNKMTKIIQFPAGRKKRNAGTTWHEEDCFDFSIAARKNAHSGIARTYGTVVRPLVFAALLFTALHGGLYASTKHKLSYIFLYAAEGGMKLAADSYLKD